MMLLDRPVLGIESSCDETSVAVTHGTKVLANVVTSQAELHRQWGGVVPEVASRAHVAAFLPALIEALQFARLTPSEIGGIAVTNRPGLVGALSVGVTAAKALALAWDTPLVGVHHLEGHILSSWLNRENVLPGRHGCLVVSGGHTEFVLVEAPGRYRIIAETIDDAAGEAFDKGARCLGLGYPGGVRVQEAARKGDPLRYKLPIALPGEPSKFSFSGLKTAVLRLTETQGKALNLEDAAASLQHAIVEALVTKAIGLSRTHQLNMLTLVGGVAANESLRHRLHHECQRDGIEFVTPDFEFCTDNAAMIAIAGSFRLAKGERDDHRLESKPSAALP